MSDYISLLTFDVPVDEAEVKRLARHGCLDIHRVEWMGAWLESGGRRLLCWYQAMDAESVRLVLRHQGLDAGGVYPSTRVSATDTVLESSAQSIILESTEQNPGGSTIPQVAHSFYTGAGRQLFVIAADTEHPAQLELLEAPNLPPGLTWQATRVDLEPEPGVLDVQLATPLRPAIPDSLRTTAPTDFDAVIIGAGISGICMLQRLLAMGLHVSVFENASDVGGVWHWNRYPGARVDSETYSYGLSFSDDLVQHWDWQELFASQAEVERYLQHVVQRFGLRGHIRLNTRIARADYDRDHRQWRVETASGERVVARYLIAATGSLSAPQLPDIPGIDLFDGESHHTGLWPPGGVALEGKRVGVVGTGASGVQVIQTIAAEVDQLSVFQRTPTYCIPQRNRDLTDEDRQRIRQQWPEILETCRASYGGFIHQFDPRSGLAVSDVEREALFEKLWNEPGFAFWLGNFADLLMNDEVNESACTFLRQKILERVDDPDVVRRLIPDHPFGVKRVPLEKDYYEIYNRPNVRLVDLRETPVREIYAHGIRTSKEDMPLDVIIYATGFDTGTGALTRIGIIGESGQTLAEKWQAGPRTYLGMLISGFPNLFMINGPQNAAGLCNASRCIEQNVDWIATCIEAMRESGKTYIAASLEAERQWTAHVNDAAEGTVLRRMKNSWFFGANTPGKPRSISIYTPGARAYRDACDRVARQHYGGCQLA
jgi:cation diffusion facilitator CzcD-associated flavoprotein CzcO